jgi:hypothetical protein
VNGTRLGAARVNPLGKTELTRNSEPRAARPASHNRQQSRGSHESSRCPIRIVLTNQTRSPGGHEAHRTGHTAPSVERGNPPAPGVRACGPSASFQLGSTPVALSRHWSASTLACARTGTDEGGRFLRKLLTS